MAATAEPQPQLLSLECVPKLSEGTFLGAGKSDVDRNMRILKERIVDIYQGRGEPLHLPDEIYEPAAVACAYKSPEARVCRRTNAPGSRFCDFHRCPVDGCVQPKSSRVQFCEVHTGASAGEASAGYVNQAQYVNIDEYTRMPRAQLVRPACAAARVERLTVRPAQRGEIAEPPVQGRLGCARGR